MAAASDTLQFIAGNVRLAQSIAVELPGGSRIAAHDFAKVERNAARALEAGDFRWKLPGGRELALGPTEFRLLEFFMQSPGRVFSREQLLNGVWGRDIYIDERTVDVHIGRLRKLLNVGRGEDPIRTVRSAGYALNAG